MPEQEQADGAEGAPEHHHHLYPLVALQIGDIQSYVSRLFLFMACKKSSLVFLVDNGPWSESRSRPAELWQLILTKSRSSPFANQRLKRRALYESPALEPPPEAQKTNDSANVECFNAGLTQFHLYNWDDVLANLQRRCRSLVHSRIFCPQFHGCVAFEVSWGDVRGMNYLNELQTDTCLSLEVKLMKKREFDCVQQAVEFYGSLCESSASGFEQFQQSGKRERSCAVDFFAEDDRCKRQCLDEDDTDIDAENNFSAPEKLPESLDSYRGSFALGTDYESGFQSPSTPVKRRLQSSHDRDFRQEVPVAETYRDALVVFRFSDPFLPFKLRDIVTLNQRLLQMLESGLPPWVIFLQSYPLLCKLYRPWMRPLARSVYFIISVVTVMIGFYDLYKNVPVLKATAAHMLGPLFEWMESWEMVSRLKYLGTMLVLQNYEKAFMWVVMSFKAVRQLVSLLMRPVMEPLQSLWSFFLPFWLAVADGVQALGVSLGTFFSSMMVTGGYIMNLVIWPFCVFLSTLWNLVYAVLCPVFSAIRVVLLLPVSAGQYIGELWTLFSSGLINLLCEGWRTISQTFQLLWVTSPFVTAANQAPRPPSVWRLLWDDLFSKVFRAVSYILNGLVAFFTALNRHRLSIYNNMVAFCVRMVYVLKSGRGVVVETWHRLHPKSTGRPSCGDDQNLKED